MRTTISSLWQELEPLVARKIGASSGGGSVAVHALSGPQHTGTLADDQAPQFLKLDGSRALVGNLAVGPGITVDGVSISGFKLAYDAHILNPAAHHAPFIGLLDDTSGAAIPDGTQRIRLSRGPGITTTQDGNHAIQLSLTLASPSGLTIDGGNNLALADSVAGAGLTISGKVLNVGAGDGLTVSADAVALTTPGALSVSTNSVSAGNHTHQVIASSNPGAGPSLLRTSAGGNLTLWDLDVVTAGNQSAVVVRNETTPPIASPHIHLLAPASLGFGSGLAFASQVPSEPHPRLALYTDGALGFGPGSTRPDVFWDRLSGGVMRLSGDSAGAEAAQLQVLGWGAFGGAAGGTAALEARSGSAAQLRLSYDGTHRADLTVGGGGNLTVEPTGQMILNPFGGVVRPANPYATDLGTLQRKWLSLHAAELWVETLVAQDTMATIGGRILVGPTTTLTADLPDVDTTILTKHNNLAVGDTVYMEADGRVEFLAVTAGPSGTGPYSYTVTRNLDGTGANSWAAGDAVFNTGRAGSGFIDLYSLSGVTDIPPTFIFNLASDGVPPFETGVFSDNLSISTDWTIWGGRSLPGDATYFGVQSGPWSSLSLTLIQLFVWTGGSAPWEYWNGSAWVTLTVASNGGSAVSRPVWTWMPPGDWQPRIINGETAYWIRSRWVSSPSSVTSYPRIGGQRASRGRRQYGPSIVGNVRNSATYNDWSEHWAIGNLSGTYDYGTDVYGFAAGRFSPTTPWVSADDSQGIRIMRGGARLAHWDLTGGITIGEIAPSRFNTRIESGSLALRVNTTAYLFANTAGLSIYDPASQSHSINLAAGAITLSQNAVARLRLQQDGTIVQGTNVNVLSGQLFVLRGNSGATGEASETLAAGDILIGRNAAGRANALYRQSPGRLEFRGGTIVQAYVDTDGSIAGGGGAVRINSAGLRLTAAPSLADVPTRLRWMDGEVERVVLHGLASGSLTQTVTAPAGQVAAYEWRAVGTTNTLIQRLNAQPTAANSGWELEQQGTAVLTWRNDGQGLKSRHGVTAFAGSQAGEGVMRARIYAWQNTNSSIPADAELISAVDTSWVHLDRNQSFTQGVQGRYARLRRGLIVGDAGLPADLVTGDDGQIRAMNFVATVSTLNTSTPFGHAFGVGGFFEARRSDITTYLQSSGWGRSSCILFNAYVGSAQSTWPYVSGQTFYTNASARAGGIIFDGNAGQLRLMIGPANSGQNTTVNWGADGGVDPAVVLLGRYSGYLHASAWSYESDRRSKTDIQPIRESSAWPQVRAALRQLVPVWSRYIADESRRLTATFIAQEVQALPALRHLVTEGHDGYLGMATTELIPYLVADNAALSDELADLRDRFDRLETIVKGLAA